MYFDSFINKPFLEKPLFKFGDALLVKRGRYYDYVVINQICSENLKTKGKKKQDLLIKLGMLDSSHFYYIMNMIYVIAITL